MRVLAHGSDIRRSVSFIIRFGNAMLARYGRWYCATFGTLFTPPHYLRNALDCQSLYT